MRTNSVVPSSRHVDSLTAPEGLILWSMRVWTRGSRCACSVESLLFRAFSTAQASAAIEPFGLMMMAIHQAAAQPLVIRCEPCRWLSADEDIVLSAIALYQAGLDDEASARMRPLLRRHATPGVTPYVTLTAWALFASGLRLPLASAFHDMLSANENFGAWPDATSATIH